MRSQPSCGASSSRGAPSASLTPATPPPRPWRTPLAGGTSFPSSGRCCTRATGTRGRSHRMRLTSCTSWPPCCKSGLRAGSCSNAWTSCGCRLGCRSSAPSCGGDRPPCPWVATHLGGCLGCRPLKVLGAFVAL